MKEDTHTMELMVKNAHTLMITEELMYQVDQTILLPMMKMNYYKLLELLVQYLSHFKC